MTKKLKKEKTIKLIENAKIYQDDNAITVTLDETTDLHAFVMDTKGNILSVPDKG